MIVKSGSIYCLKNPITSEIFYVGATQWSLKKRLRVHYQHLKEYERGDRLVNKRYLYLQNLRPLKAEINLLELIIDADIDKREIYFIKKIREINPNLTNMTDGGRGSNTSKYYTEKQMEEYSKKLSASQKGIAKSELFKKHLSKIRTGLGNPAAKEMACGWLVAFKNGVPLRMFKYGFEIDSFIGSPHAYGNIYKRVNEGGLRYGYEIKKFTDCSDKDKDLVETLYVALSRPTTKAIILSNKA